MTVYDVTIANDTQRNIHLTDHHTLGMKLGHTHQTLYIGRLDTLAEKNATTVRGVMEDYKLRNLRDSHTLGWSWNWNT
jgi:hypothetical protein